MSEKTIVQELTTAKADLEARDLTIKDNAVKISDLTSRIEAQAGEFFKVQELVKGLQAKVEGLEANVKAEAARADAAEAKIKLTPALKDVTEGREPVRHAVSTVKTAEDAEAEFRAAYASEKDPQKRASIWRAHKAAMKVLIVLAIALVANFSFAQDVGQKILAYTQTSPSTNTASAIVVGTIKAIGIGNPAMTGSVALAGSSGQTVLSQLSIAGAAATNWYYIKTAIHATSGSAISIESTTNGVPEGKYDWLTVADTLTATFKTTTGAGQMKVIINYTK